MKDENKKTTRKKVASPFATNLALVLRERALSLRAAAEMAGVSVSVIAGWTTGTQPGDVMAVNRLAKGLGVSFAWLMVNEGPREIRAALCLEDLFDEHEAFNGVYKISAKKLVLRKSGEGEK